jgi:ATP-dependent helicase YprA (DUF1998 family)
MKIIFDEWSFFTDQNKWHSADFRANLPSNSFEMTVVNADLSIVPYLCSRICIMTFENLEIIPPILEALKALGYTEPTPIQAQAIPILLQGRDLLGCAQTGTGKTCAFVVPILQMMHSRVDLKAKGKKIKALIITPTRELAIQIDESIRDYGKNSGRLAPHCHFRRRQARQSDPRASERH